MSSAAFSAGGGWSTVVQFKSRAEIEHERLIKEARAQYASIFPQEQPTKKED